MDTVKQQRIHILILLGGSSQTQKRIYYPPISSCGILPFHSKSKYPFFGWRIWYNWIQVDEVLQRMEHSNGNKMSMLQIRRNHFTCAGSRRNSKTDWSAYISATYCNSNFLHILSLRWLSNFEDMLIMPPKLVNYR